MHVPETRSLPAQLLTRAPEAAAASFACRKSFDHTKSRAHHGYDHHLRDPVKRLDRVERRAAVPAAHHQRTLVVRVDQPDEVAEHDAVPVPKARPGQDHRREARIADVDGDSGRNQLGASGRKDEGGVDARAQVHAGRAGGCVGGQVAADALIEDADFDRRRYRFPMPWRLPAAHGAYPRGLATCHRHASAHIAPSPRAARQPRQAAARLASAHETGTSPARRGTTS